MTRERDSMTQEAFLALAATLGLELSEQHAAELFPEVSALLERVEGVHDIDASSVPPEHGVSSWQDGGIA